MFEEVNELLKANSVSKGIGYEGGTTDEQNKATINHLVKYLLKKERRWLENYKEVLERKQAKSGVEQHDEIGLQILEVEDKINSLPTE